MNAGIIVRTDREIWASRPVLTTAILREARHVMAARNLTDSPDQLSLGLDGDHASKEVPMSLRMRKTWKTLLGTFVICKDCGKAAQRNGPGQLYCEPCSDERHRLRALKWAKAHPPTTEATRKTYRNVRNRSIAFGAELSKGERWPMSDLFRDVTDMVWVRRFSVPFSYALSKNHVYSMSKEEGHIFMRGESRSARAYICGEVKKALSDVLLVKNKLWIDLLVQKPNHSGDAINVIDLVADAVKDAIPLDDRWFCIQRVDWQVIKDDPLLLIGLGQKSTEDVQVCSHCGRVLPFACFWKNKTSKWGIGRACKECVRAK